MTDSHHDGGSPGTAAALAAAATITALLRAQAAACPADVGQWSLAAGGSWQPMPWCELHDRVATISRGLRELGLVPGGTVALFAAGTPAWDQVQLAVLAAGGVVVGLDTLATSSQLEDMLALTQPVGLVVDDLAALERLPAAAVSAMRFIVATALAADADAMPPHAVRVTSLAGLHQRHRRRTDTDWDLATPDGLAWVIFTSGTTGQPKALMYRHRQIVQAVQTLVDAFDDIDQKARLVSWLPLSNPFQRMINLCAIARGAQTFYVPDPREVMRHLPTIRPHVFIGVPRFFEKFHAAALAAVEGAGRWRAPLGRWAIGAGTRCAALRRSGASVPLTLRVQLGLADALVLRRIRSAFGGELRYLISGSAPMPVWLLERLHGMGLLVLEAYGLSECIVPVAANRSGSYRFGSVGRVMQGNEVRLADDGELLLKSTGVCEHYLGIGEPTSLVDAAGWLATGDFAEIDHDGFLHLIGRKSEIFKTSTGRRVAPAAVEAVLRSVPCVDQAAVFGGGQKHLSAVITLVPEAVSIPVIRDRLRLALLTLPDYMRPACAVISRRPFTVDSGELTGNLKLRRHHIAKNYAAALAALESMDVAPDRNSTIEFERGTVELISL